ncbi:hypothetical protein Y1Q_0015532 [Alligator mississippiensis]|uniref:Uncharacterized protein n=1 Tax=Alligator mississippiensis TaxID=8496 RepID=A0A151NN52_ALLMI|nr:hypothetical protein Y1Q_0015532 [Alligator mississippiensis]
MFFSVREEEIRVISAIKEKSQRLGFQTVRGSSNLYQGDNTDLSILDHSLHVLFTSSIVFPEILQIYSVG